MLKRSLILLLLLLMALCSTAPAAPGPSISPHTDSVTATRAWLETVPAEQRAKTDSYFEGGYWLLLWNFLLTAAISLLLLTSGISAKLRDFAERRTRFKAMQVILYAIPFLLLTVILSFPLNIYQNFFREHAYGLATQNLGQWLSEQFVALLLQLFAASLFLIILYVVFRRAPRVWWLWGTLVSVLFLSVVSFVAPVYIEPLFNTYKPLRDAAISEPILALARANEIPVTQVYEVDASRQSNRVSANVSGFLGTTRIALNDNLLKQCTLPEIRQVMGHEMGHYVLNHTTKLIVAFSLVFLLAFALMKLGFDRTIARWGDSWKVRGIADPAGLPLLLLLFAAAFSLLTPITNSITRTVEHEADAFGINTSREADGMAKVALKLGAYRKLDPSPLEEFIFFDHPSGRARIQMAMDWKAAQLPAGDSP